MYAVSNNYRIRIKNIRKQLIANIAVNKRADDNKEKALNNNTSFRRIKLIIEKFGFKI